MRPAVSVLERMVLMFPLAVVLSATAAFWFGGVCAWWQFAVGVLAAAAAGASHRRVAWRARVAGMGLFAFFLGAVWVATGCLAFNGCDNVGYHLPVTRLLMEGWNPLWEGTPEGLAAAAGLPLGGMWHWHVLYIAHPVEVFNAVFALFTREPFDLVFPLTPFLLLPALGALWRFARGEGWPRWVRLAVALMAVGSLTSVGFALDGGVDQAVAYATVGAMVTMARILRGERAWGALLAFSLWMMVAKQSALLTCFVFWACFAAVGLWRARRAWRGWLARMAACGAALTLGLCWVCTVPYLTSWARIGHPLYPACSADEARFPTYDITFDFHDKNADAEAMGYAGLLLNAYVSPRLARAYYAWKLDRPDFKPWCRVWAQGSGADGTQPTTLPERLILSAAFALLLALGGRGACFVAALGVIGVVAFPPAYVGYLRYVPWIWVMPILAVGALAVAAARKWRPAGYAIAGTAAAGALLKGLFFAAIPIDHAFELKAALRDPGLAALYRAEETATNANALLLLWRQTPALRDLPLLDADAPHPRKRDFGLPYLAAALKPGAEPPISYHRSVTRQSSRTQRYLRYLLFVPRTYALALPRLVWWRLGDLRGRCVAGRQSREKLGYVAVLGRQPVDGQRVPALVRRQLLVRPDLSGAGGAHGMEQHHGHRHREQSGPAHPDRRQFDETRHLREGRHGRGWIVDRADLRPHRRADALHRHV